MRVRAVGRTGGAAPAGRPTRPPRPGPGGAPGRTPPLQGEFGLGAQHRRQRGGALEDQERHAERDEEQAADEGGAVQGQRARPEGPAPQPALAAQVEPVPEQRQYEHRDRHFQRVDGEQHPAVRGAPSTAATVTRSCAWSPRGRPPDRTHFGGSPGRATERRFFARSHHTPALFVPGHDRTGVNSGLGKYRRNRSLDCRASDGVGRRYFGYDRGTRGIDGAWPVHL